MPDKFIGFMNQPPPRKKRPLKDVLKIPIAIALVLAVAGGVVYRYINYREEGRVHEFLQLIGERQYGAAYAFWDGSSTYLMKDFLDDWGPSGYYTKGMKTARIVTSHRAGSVVNVRVSIDTYAKPIELRV